MDKENIINKLHNGICKVIFTKNNGESRVLQCTLNDKLLPTVESNEEGPKRTRKQNPDVMSVWDVENSGWRSFRWDSITDFSAEHNL
jgi:hypothetical protein